MAGKMKASAVADAPPVISNITPRSQVTKATATFISNSNSTGTLAHTQHGSQKDGCREEDVPLHIEGLVREKVLLDDLVRARLNQAI